MDAQFSIVDLIPTAALILRADGSIRHTNSAATAMLSECIHGHGECLAGKCVIDALVKASANRAVTRSRQLNYVLDLLDDPPLKAIFHDIEEGGENLILALLFKEGPTVPISEDLLCKLYGLTAAESRLAAYLVGNQGAPKDIALALDVSVNTVRTHMKRIFAKVGVPSQVELVRRILSGPALYAHGVSTPPMQKVMMPCERAPKD
ncbi:hypothetical protein CU669_20190 [Paramagnetospirillum kuznetsovii]|uniref:HTH luxR-type domain-containing protein n=1 Tax=Paramagnetospirillum kuznetsovii TaxID=2053833 RepID=A0A364NSN9_9PROT|nr:helix-turn-helix transcriptional regulator [Paramagnetospirillum kuznetsovii]RAU20101.1 hypothetical protein CU669_20190 [Paramagnetospirillum kuznetsovii]